MFYTLKMSLFFYIHAAFFSKGEYIMKTNPEHFIESVINEREVKQNFSSNLHYPPNWQHMRTQRLT